MNNKDRQVTVNCSSCGEKIYINESDLLLMSTEDIEDIECMNCYNLWADSADIDNFVG